MDTSRIVINTIDNSTSEITTTTPVVGYTVVKSPKGSITPQKIYSNNTSKLKDILGVSSLEYPELFEVETYNKEYDIYVSAPYSSAKVPVLYISTNGAFLGKDLLTYDINVENFIFDGTNYSEVEGLSYIKGDKVSVLKPCSASYQDKKLYIDLGFTSSDIINTRDIKIKGFADNYTKDISISKTSDAFVINADSKLVCTLKVKNDSAFSTASISDGGNLYLEIADATNYHYIETIFSIAKYLNALSVYKIEDELAKDIKALIIPKYPSERKLHIDFSSFRESTGYVSTVASQRNILKMYVYEEGAFHNESSKLYIQGTLATNNLKQGEGFNSYNKNYANQELIYVQVLKPFSNSDDLSKKIEGYGEFVLDGGIREFHSKVKVETDGSIQLQENTVDKYLYITKDESPVKNKTYYVLDNSVAYKFVKKVYTDSDTFEDKQHYELYTDVTALHNLGWEQVNKGDFDEVDVFFDSVAHTGTIQELRSSSFFTIGGKKGPQNNQYSGHIFNYTPEVVPSSIDDKLTFGNNYWNICNLAVMDLDNGDRIFSPLTGARALMQSRIIEGNYGGVAPMWTNTNGMGGQLSMINPYRLKYKYTKAELDAFDLYNYNPVILDRNYGVMITGQKTCKDDVISDWSYIGNVCAFQRFIKVVRQNVMIPQIGCPNNEYYRTLRKEQILQYLRNRTEGTNNIWASASVDTSTADGVNDEYNRSARKFVIKVRVKVEVFSEIVELNFYNEDQSTDILINN